MGQELQIPDAFKVGMAKTFAGALNAHDDNLSEGIGQSYGVIGYKGKVWSIRYRGERKTVLRPDDGTPSSYLDVIVLGQAKTKSKSYYKKFDQQTSEGDRPICASIDGTVPDADVTVKQHANCAACPRNVWKTDPETGRKGRECTDYKRLAVLVLPTQTKSLFGGVALMEPLFLRVPPDSLNSLAIMGETMSAQGFHYSAYITRITFDPDKAHPCMVFRPLQPLSEQEAPVILDLRENAMVGRITGGDIAVGAMKAVEQAILPKTDPAPSSSGLGGVTGISSGLSGDAPPATPKQTTAPSTAQTSSSAAGSGLFGGATVVSDAPSLSAGSPTVVDSGAPEASDAELDEMIRQCIAVAK